MFRAQLLILENISISRHLNKSHLQIITLFLFYHAFYGVLLGPDSYIEDIIIEEISIPVLLTGFA